MATLDLRESERTCKMCKKRPAIDAELNGEIVHSSYCISCASALIEQIPRKQNAPRNNKNPYDLSNRRAR